MNVLVTGGAGYVGFSLVRALAHRSDIDQIRVIDSLTNRNYALFVSGSHGPVPVEFRRVDILDGYGLDAALEGINTVFHLAGHATTNLVDQQAHSFEQINNWGTAQLARSVENAADVRKIVYLSSFAVYGSHDEVVDEDTLPAPTSAYGLSKLHGEAQIERLNGQRDVWVIRAANAFGVNPAFRGDTVVNAMAFDAWTERRIRIDGDGEQTRPFTEVDALGTALSQIPSSAAPTGVYNLATQNASVNELAQILVELVPNLEVFHASRDIRMQRIALALPVKLAQYVDLPRRPLAEAVADLVDGLAGQTS